MKCKSCETVLRENSKFCHSCGTKIELEIKCHNCDTKLKHDDRFCNHCGTQTKLDLIYPPSDTKQIESIWNDIDYGAFDKVVETVQKGLVVSPIEFSKVPKNRYGTTIANLSLNTSSSATGQGQNTYFIDGSTIYRIDNRLNTLEKVYSHKENFCMLWALNVVESQLYYCDDNSIFAVETSGNNPRLIFDLNSYMEGVTSYIDFMIVIEKWIYFIGKTEKNPFIARVTTHGDQFHIIYEPAPEVLNPYDDGGFINIFNISKKYIFFEFSGITSTKMIVSTDGLKCAPPHEWFDYSKILDNFSNVKNSDEEWREEFDSNIRMIDFDKKWLYFNFKTDMNRDRERVSFDGNLKERYWLSADWENQTNNASNNRPNKFYLDFYFDWSDVCVGFCYGGPHYYSLFRAHSDGKVVCLGGDGGSGISDLQVVGEWAYWHTGSNKIRQNINTLEQQKLDLKEMKITTI